MRPVVTEPRPAPSRRNGAALALLGAGVAVSGLLLAVMSATNSPARVGHLTIDNPHEWTATVEVAAVDRDGWVGLGTVDRKASQRFEEVLDQGSQWRFRFSYAGTDGGELTLSRSELERRGWNLAVPDTFRDRMRAAGLIPSRG